jgi:hypothetical protein
MNASGVELKQAPPLRIVGNRVKPWLRRLGLSALTVFAVVTALSVIFNAVTKPPPFADPGFGQFVQVGALAVHFQRWGDWGSAIVLVPGFLESSVVWSAVGPLLGQNHIVYGLGLPGDGCTRNTSPMILGSQADLVDGFVEALHRSTQNRRNVRYGTATPPRTARRAAPHESRSQQPPGMPSPEPPSPSA